MLLLLTSDRFIIGINKYIFNFSVLGFNSINVDRQNPHTYIHTSSLRSLMIFKCKGILATEKFENLCLVSSSLSRRTNCRAKSPGSLPEWAAVSSQQQQSPSRAPLALSLSWKRFFQRNRHQCTVRPGSRTFGWESCSHVKLLHQIWDPLPHDTGSRYLVFRAPVSPCNAGIMLVYTPQRTRRAPTHGKCSRDVSYCSNHCHNIVVAPSLPWSKRATKWILKKKKSLLQMLIFGVPQEGWTAPGRGFLNLERNRILLAWPSLRSDSSLEYSRCGITP